MANKTVTLRWAALGAAGVISAEVICAFAFLRYQDWKSLDLIEKKKASGAVLTQDEQAVLTAAHTP